MQARTLQALLGALGALLLIVGVVLVGVVPSPAGAERPNLAGTTAPFYAVQTDELAVPSGVMPWNASWSPDGLHIIFMDMNNGGVWTANADGSDAECLTCSMSDAPTFIGGFAAAFPDNQRLLWANAMGNSVYILDCAPTLYDCETHQWLPVNLSGDSSASEPTLQRRTFHLAPDGVHLGYTIARPDGTIMIVGQLVQQSTQYVLENDQVINPPGPASATHTSPVGWANTDQSWELKSFADGGSSVIVSSQPQGLLPQTEEINLATGQVTQLSGYDDWSEDAAVSPDGSSLLEQSQRTENRFTVLGLMPIAEPFVALPADAVLGSQAGYASVTQGCTLQPWLLPSGGDQDGQLVGQPLDPYPGGETVAGTTDDGQQVWSPDSTSVLIGNQSLEAPPAGANSFEIQHGPTPSELTIAHILRPPTTPISTVTTTVGSWAPSPQAYQTALDYQGAHTVYGPASGSAVINLNGNLEAGGTFSTTYTDYSQDGQYYLNGTDSVTYSVSASTPSGITANLVATDSAGNTVGDFDADLTATKISPAPPTGQPTYSLSGSISASWMGQTASGLPGFGACPQSMPTAPPLQIDAVANGNDSQTVVTATVTADSYGDTRPVQGATVTVAGQTATSGSNGVASVTVSPQSGTITVQATAGNTFQPATTSLTTVPPVITSADSTSFTPGVTGSFQVTTSGVPTPALSESGALPPGVGFTDDGDGTATIAYDGSTSTSGTYPIDVTASNGAGPDASQNFIVTMTTAASTTSTSPTRGSIVLGASDSDTATVTGSASLIDPTGSMGFYECGPSATPEPCTSQANQVGDSVPLDGNANPDTVVSASFTPTATGYWCFAGYYSGDSNYAPASDQSTDECFMVTQAASATVTQPSSSTAALDGPNSDAASITGDDGTANAPYPTGTVTFYTCAVNVDPCTSSSWQQLGNPTSLGVGSGDTNSAISQTFDNTSPGTWCFAAVYSGDSNYSASSDQSSDECYSVSHVTTSTISAPVNTTVTEGQSNADEVTVTGAVTVGAPTGTVTFYECGPTPTETSCDAGTQIGNPDNLTSSGSDTSVAASAAFTPPDNLSSIGYWCFRAVYNGDSNYQSSSDNTADECFYLNGPVAITTTSPLPNGRRGHAYTDRLMAVGGTAPYTWSYTGALPAGLTLRSSGLLSGTPTKKGTYTFTAKVKDSSPSAREKASEPITLVITK